MALALTAAAGGTGPLARVVLTIPTTRNLQHAACTVRCLNGTTLAAHTGVRIRTTHHLPPDATASRNYQAACRDANGAWSEWGGATALATANFSAGVTDGSMASGAVSDDVLQEPGAKFPELSQSTSLSAFMATLTDDAFVDESRRGKWAMPLSRFSVSLRNLDEAETLLLHRMYRACNGPLKRFFFDFTDPQDGTVSWKLMRFQDAELGDTLQAVRLSDASFKLVETSVESEGSTA